MKIKGREMDPRVWAVLVHAEKWMLGGSRAVMHEDDLSPETDWDYIVLLPMAGTAKHGALYNALHANGFSEFPDGEYDPGTPETKPKAPATFLWELDHIDLILCPTEAEYEKWETATKVCQKLHLTEREDRLMIHRAVRWGKWFEKPPEPVGLPDVTL